MGNLKGLKIGDIISIECEDFDDDGETCLSYLYRKVMEDSPPVSHADGTKREDWVALSGLFRTREECELALPFCLFPDPYHVMYKPGMERGGWVISIRELTCPKCKKEKLACEFHKDKSRPNGYTFYCKECRNEYAKECRNEYAQRRSYRQGASKVERKKREKFTVSLDPEVIQAFRVTCTKDKMKYSAVAEDLFKRYINRRAKGKGQL